MTADALLNLPGPIAPIAGALGRRASPAHIVHNRDAMRALLHVRVLQ